VTRPIPLRGPIHPDIDERLVSDLVEAFYERVRADELLGPIFTRVIRDWDHHLALLKDFWSSVTMMTGRYKGTPLQAHQRIGGLGFKHFERWLSLWRETCAATCSSSEIAGIFIERAERIASSLSSGVLEATPSISH
jgi:hemoglobin